MTFITGSDKILSQIYINNCEYLALTDCLRKELQRRMGMRNKSKPSKSSKNPPKKISLINMLRKVKAERNARKSRKTASNNEKTKKSASGEKSFVLGKTSQVVLEASQKAQSTKFDLGIAAAEKPKRQTTAASMPKQTFQLPFRYFDNKIVIMVRDPWWLHAYWDISKEREGEVISQIPNDEKYNLKRILRIYDVTGKDNFTGLNANNFFDVEINDIASSWYVNVKPETSLCVDIGFLSNKGVFYLLARSNVVSTPYFGISSLLDEEWVLPDDDYFKILGIYDLGKSSLERRKKFQELFQRQISSLGASESFSPMGRKKKARKFFLEVYTELILYGRTESDARVTLKGEKVNLKKDGTFSFRFALPVGNFDFPVEATSSSGKDKIKITPVVKRSQK